MKKLLHTIQLVRIILVLILCLLSSTVSAKVHISYCMSHEDLKNDVWQTTVVDSIIVSQDNDDSVPIYEIFVGDKAEKKKFKKKVVAIQLKERILLNITQLTGKGAGVTRGAGKYVRAYRLTENRILVSYYDIAKMSRTRAISSQFGLLGGLVGAAVEQAMDKKVCYITSLGEKKLKRLKNEVLEELLSDHDDLIQSYKSSSRKDRNSDEAIIPLLKEANLLLEDYDEVIE